MRFRVKKTNNVYKPQVKKFLRCRWENINTKEHLFREYSGVGTEINAIQNLYEFISKLNKFKYKAFSINLIGEEYIVKTF